MFWLFGQKEDPKPLREDKPPRANKPTGNKSRPITRQTAPNGPSQNMHDRRPNGNHQPNGNNNKIDPQKVQGYKFDPQKVQLGHKFDPQQQIQAGQRLYQGSGRNGNGNSRGLGQGPQLGVKTRIARRI